MITIARATPMHGSVKWVIRKTMAALKRLAEAVSASQI